MCGVYIRGDYFWFSFVFMKKNNQTEYIFFFKNRNRFKPTGFGLVRFGFIWQKLVQTGLPRFWLFFFRFGSVFLVWLGFFPVVFWFGFGLVFSVIFFGFLGLIGFLVFFLTPSLYEYYLKIKYFFWLWIIDSRLSYKL